MKKRQIPGGERFGRLTVITESESVRTAGGKPLRQFRCRCECGNELDVRIQNLTGGLTKSCGCLKAEGNRQTHGETRTPLHNIWKSMRQRCTPGRSGSEKYADKGITVCDDWQDFESFATWSRSNGWEDVQTSDPGQRMSIDRIDPSGNYEPANCRWITVSENSKARWKESA